MDRKQKQLVIGLLGAIFLGPFDIGLMISALSIYRTISMFSKLGSMGD
ncbi:hypothetical protein L1765_06195 [Microaerobacter geothermalis]|nr:hypothetical protein [Microaerobacter geothermalis]MCF6093577.1 hypothetical protein [Microaerobacter geothermalis]